MSTKWLGILVIAATLLFGNINAQGQETAREPSISELKEQIAKLLSIDRDETVPADVKSINRQFLEQRRGQLRLLLQKNIEGLRSYRAKAGSVLTAEETKVIERSISEWQADLDSQQAQLPQAPTLTQPVSSPATSTVPAIDGNGSGNGSTTLNNSSGSTLGPSMTAHAAAPPAPGQDLVPKGSDPAGTDVVRDDVRRQLAAVVREVSGAQAVPGVRTLAQARKEAFDITANPQLYAELIALILTNKMLPRDDFIRDIETARIDKQVGGGETNAGSTSLVTKGGTPAILGFAVENGALSRNVDGTTVTFRGNPVGLVEALQKKGFVPSFEDDSESAKLLRKLSFSLSFDTSRGASPGTLLANRQQLSGYSLRYEFKNDRDPRNHKYKTQWESLVTDHAQKVANDIGRVMRFLDTHPAYRSWLTSAKEAVGGASNAELADVITQQFDGLQAIEIPAELAALVESFSTDFTAYRGHRSKLLEIVAQAPIFTFEYVNARRPGLIDTSNLKFIAETGLFKGKGDLTYNGSLTFFNANPGPGMKRIRDFDNSLRLDVPLGDVRKIGNFVLTFAGQYKRLMENDMTSTNGVMNIKGDIATGQVLFTIPVKGSGFKIPLSFTFANRTELVKEREVRGNFGFTFDLDALFAKFKPF